MRAREVPREKPVGRPLADPAQDNELLLHLVVRQRRKSGEVRAPRREADDVLRLTARKAVRIELVLVRARDPFAGRERPARPTLAEALDEPVPDRGRRDERDLLRRDRADEHLERIGDQRRPEADERRHELTQHLVACRPRIERLGLQREADERTDDGLLSSSSGSASTPPGAGSIPQLATADHAVQSSPSCHKTCAVDAERAKARRRQLERERLRSREKQV